MWQTPGGPQSLKYVLCGRLRDVLTVDLSELVRGIVGWREQERRTLEQPQQRAGLEQAATKYVKRNPELLHGPLDLRAEFDMGDPFPWDSFLTWLPGHHSSGVPPPFLPILPPCLLLVPLHLWDECLAPHGHAPVLSSCTLSLFCLRAARCRVLEGFGVWAKKKMWPWGGGSTHVLYWGMALLQQVSKGEGVFHSRNLSRSHTMRGTSQKRRRAGEPPGRGELERPLFVCRWSLWVWQLWRTGVLQLKRLGVLTTTRPYQSMVGRC